MTTLIKAKLKKQPLEQTKIKVTNFMFKAIFWQRQGSYVIPKLSKNHHSKFKIYRMIIIILYERPLLFSRTDRLTPNAKKNSLVKCF